MPQIASNVTYGTLASSISTLIIWLLEQFHIAVPGEVGAAIATVTFFAVSHGIDVATGGNKPKDKPDAR